MRVQAQSFTVSHKGRVSVLKSPVTIFQAFDPLHTPSPPSSHDFTAIWDTGATNTVITQKVVDHCDLKPIGRTIAKTAQGEMQTPVYLVNVMLPNKVGFANLRVTRGNTGGDADVLIGMDIVGIGDFAITNKDGKTVFSFRAPSCDTIDFLTESKSAIVKTTTAPTPVLPNKVGRNDPCPCGSGKKYKKGCGK